MIKLFIKILFIATIAIACNTGINYFFYKNSLPAFRGDKQLLGKFNTLKRNREEYNTIFIGSSKTHYHIAPRVFDSVLNNRTGSKIRSYNFGIDGMMPPESFFICRELLKSNHIKIKNIVFELVFLKTSDTKNICTYRGFYWANNEYYRFFSSSLLASGCSANSKIWNLGLISFMRAENLLNLGKFNEYIDYAANPDYTDPDEPLAGFEGLQANKLTPLDNLLIDNTQTASLQAFSNFDAWSRRPPNKFYLAQINELTQLAKQHHVHIIFIMPMLWGYTWQYQELFPIYYNLPQKDQLIMADAKKYPYHFQKDKLYDAIHLSKANALRYTTDMATVFAQKSLLK